MGQHWLVEVAVKAKLNGSKLLHITPQTLIVRAWSEVTSACEITSDELCQHVADHFGLPKADFCNWNMEAASTISEKIARKYLIVPLREDGQQMVIATCDPCNLELEQSIWFVSGSTPKFEIASPEAITDALANCYSMENTGTFLLKLTSVLEGKKGIDSEAIYEAVDITDSPVATLSNLILRSAVLDGASDIHIEPERHAGIVRFRIDGVLRHRLQMPLSIYKSLVSRIKVMGNLDIAKHMVPQDGRSKILVGNNEYDLRIASMPTQGTEKIVVRVLDSAKMCRFEELNITTTELERFQRLLYYRDGIIIVTGPTGSGKTTTLYSALATMVTGEENIMTVEDPVEYDLPGITQIQVEPKQGLTFAEALRHILRQDPDVILIGEIRDAETALIASQTAITGHMVLSTLHTNDALGTIFRLENFGLSRHMISETLRGALAQRLVRKVCNHCVETKSVLSLQEKVMAEYYKIPFSADAVGCMKCERTGFYGRIPVVEIMIRTPELQEQIAAGARAQELQKTAIKNGMRPFAEVMLDRVRMQETTLLEAIKVFGDLYVNIPIEFISAHKQSEKEQEIAHEKVERRVLNRSQICKEFKQFAETDRNKGNSSLAIVDIAQNAESEQQSDEKSRQIAQIILSKLPDTAIVGHWTASELVILLPESNAKQAVAYLLSLLDGIRKTSMSQQGITGNSDAAFIFSSGVTDISGIKQIHEALARADRFLYRAKSLGNNQVLSGPPTSGLHLCRPMQN